MGDESDGEEADRAMDIELDNSGTKRQHSLEEIQNIIGVPTQNQYKRLASEKNKVNKKSKNTDKDKHEPTSSKDKTTQQKTRTDNVSTKNTTPKQTANSSLKMKEIINRRYKNLYYINTNKTFNRFEMADLWTKTRGNPNDVMLQTKKGFLLKSNSDKKVLIERLEKLKSEKNITKYEETAERELRAKDDNLTASYSAVIATVEQEVSDEELSSYLNHIEIEHRYCKRIVSKKTGKNTYLIRIITGCIRSFEKLLNEGLFYKNKHYPVYTSLPPPPAPMPCGRCFEFTHKTEECTTPLTCHKCSGNHHTNKCTSELPVRCKARNAEDHAAWSFRCPNRPTSTLPNIPNIPIKSINKKTEEIQSDLKKENRIHKPVTKHDFIINSYIVEINNPDNLNREETIMKLRKRFVDLWKIDTTAVFTQNRLYVLMFDLDSNQDSPTEPLASPNNLQWRI